MKKFFPKSKNNNLSTSRTAERQSLLAVKNFVVSKHFIKWRIFGGSVLQYKLMEKMEFWWGSVLQFILYGKLEDFLGSARKSGALLVSERERERRSKN